MKLSKAAFFAGIASLALSTSVLAKDMLDNTKWKIINESGKTESYITIKKEGKFFVGRLQPLNKNEKCKDCKGKYANKTLNNVPILFNLAAKGKGKYADGRIFDPLENKTYKLKAELKDNNQKLAVRGYIGVSLLGRTQTWVRAK